MTEQKRSLRQQFSPSSGPNAPNFGLSRALRARSTTNVPATGEWYYKCKQLSPLAQELATRLHCNLVGSWSFKLPSWGFNCAPCVVISSLLVVTAITYGAEPPACCAG